MRCGRCGKNFDEEMYSGICPKCGHFNNRQKEYDVSGYFSARFDGDDKVSTSAQAAKQHEQLHRMYDSQNMHKVNPYQTGQPGMQGNTYQTGQSGAYGQAKAYGEKEKNIVTPICVVIAVLAIIITVVGCQLKRQSLEKAYYTLDFEKEEAQPGELFEIGTRLLIVDKVETVDTSDKVGMPEDEKLIAVSVELLPTEEGSSASGNVYVSDGSSYKMPLEDYTVKDILYDGDYSMGDDILSRYDFNGYVSADGKTGKLYFLIDKTAEEICVCFEEENEKSGLSVLDRRVSVSLQLKEDGL